VLLAAVCLGIVTLACVRIADVAVFERSGPLFWQSVLATPVAVGFLIFGDRILAHCMGAVVYAGTMFALAAALWFAIQRYVTEPQRMRRFVEAKRREKKTLEALGDDTF